MTSRFLPHCFGFTESTSHISDLIDVILSAIYSTSNTLAVVSEVSLFYLPVFNEDGQNFSQVEDVARCRVVFQWEQKTIFFQFSMKLLLFLTFTHRKCFWGSKCWTEWHHPFQDSYGGLLVQNNICFSLCFSAQTSCSSKYDSYRQWQTA